MKRVKVLVFTTLVILTFTVIVYDIHVFFNPPKVLYLVVLGEAYPESWTMEDITNHPLGERIMHYVNVSMSTENSFGKRRVYIINDPEVEEFFGKYYVSTWCGTCNSAYLKDGDTYYYFMVGYSNVRLSLLEYAVAWTVSVATAILWIFTFSFIQKLRAGKEVKT